MNTPELRLLKDQERRLVAGHCWIYSNEVNTQATPLKAFEPGQAVQVIGHSGRWLGHAYVNPHSLICARLVSRNRRPPLEPEPVGAPHPHRPGTARAALRGALLPPDLRRERRAPRAGGGPLWRSACGADHHRRDGAGPRRCAGRPGAGPAPQGHCPAQRYQLAGTGGSAPGGRDHPRHRAGDPGADRARDLLPGIAAHRAEDRLVLRPGGEPRAPGALRQPQAGAGCVFLHRGLGGAGGGPRGRGGVRGQLRGGPGAGGGERRTQRGLRAHERPPRRRLRRPA